MSIVPRYFHLLAQLSTTHNKGESTYTQQALYFHPAGSPESTGKTDPPGDGGGTPIGGRPLPVKLYTLRRLGPPQVSALFPLQAMEQSPAGVGAPPLEKVAPQSFKKEVNGRGPKIAVAMDNTYNIRQSIPCQLGDNPKRSRQQCSFQRCRWQLHQWELLGRLEFSRQRCR